VLGDESGVERDEEIEACPGQSGFCRVVGTDESPGASRCVGAVATDDLVDAFDVLEEAFRSRVAVEVGHRRDQKRSSDIHE
jgi:hypothetical protein